MKVDHQINPGTLDPSNLNLSHLDRKRCRKARLARDARFDGLFYIGVRTTGIFCRPICPATPPHEKNVDYFVTALAAHQSGLRPCLRCRPEAAPGSPAWCGTQTTLTRALRLIDNGEWREQSLPEFAERLGVSDRYLRRLFQQHLGVSPLKYANFRRALFAKQLLQQTSFPVPEVAFMAGFGSTRRFNAVFADLLGINPRQMRRAAPSDVSKSNTLTVLLSYRPPYDWVAVRDFYAMRQIAGLEVVTETSYSRSFSHHRCEGVFTATHSPDKHGFRIELSLSHAEYAMALIQRIRRLLDLDADSSVIANHLSTSRALDLSNKAGIRLPGLWSPFEAGVRAILGQQVSVKAAHNLVTRLVTELGKPLAISKVTTGKIDADSPSVDESPTVLFPQPEAVANSKLAFLAMPDKRRQALRLLAQYLLNKGDNGSPQQAREGRSFQDWLSIPGIGPWTVQYTAFRMGDPDIFLEGDLGVKNALKKLGGISEKAALLDSKDVSPWGSYATLSLWQTLSQNPIDSI
jgi:AraC family transcriptional regulator of adaptative response / DNA-3-methyladenine glycosylase II